MARSVAQMTCNTAQPACPSVELRQQMRVNGSNAVTDERPAHLKKEHSMDLLRILLAILLPPLGVFLQVGIGLQFWLNILLTLLGYIPGIIHAIWIIIRR
jgi:uncharacterized membrane protein YqaE (UPF0057 family)